MGKFTNTTYKDTIDNITESMNNILNNQFYKWNDQSPTETTFFNPNKDKSTLDQGSNLAYEDIGPNSPIVYDRIDHCFLYGLEKFLVNLSREDFGVESDAIEGEATVLPNTFIPYPGSYFYINYLKEDYLFKVNSVNLDTVETGANLYKISYKLETMEKFKYIENQVEDTYTMVIDNVGTSYKAIVRTEVYSFIQILDDILISLKRYFKSIFYSTRVQTFIYNYLQCRTYDPYMIEFILRNDLLSGDDEYIYITHQASVPKTFPIMYNETFFRCLEKKDISNIDRYKIKATAQYINEVTSIFDTRVESYFKVTYDMYLAQNNTIPAFTEELIEHIKRNELFDNEYCFYNIIVKYFNNEDITQKDLDDFDIIEYRDNVELFYAIPSVIFCIERYIKDRLNNNIKADE